jgi:outer membrane lipoprotein-sorting protein
MRMAIFFTAALAIAQTPDPKSLIAESADAIKKYQSYRLESVVTVDLKGGKLDTHLEMPSSISVRRPDRMRIESKSQAGTIEIVSDGEHTWFYLSALKKYIKRDAVGSPEAAVGASGLLPKSLPDLEKSMKSMKVIGDDTIDVAGVKHPCWVIETAYGEIILPEQHLVIRSAIQTNWISKAEKLSLQNTFSGEIDIAGVSGPVTMAQSTKTTAIRLNAKFPDSTFVFTPPATAKQGDDWSLPGISKPDLVGKPAPDSVPKGKAVVLHFTAPWCVPCTREAALLDKIPELNVKHINVEDAASADLVAALSINSYPTSVIIDADGKITAYETGARTESVWRAALAKLAP